MRSDNKADDAQTQARVRKMLLLGLIPNFIEKAWTDFLSSEQISRVHLLRKLPRTCSIHEPLLGTIVFCQSEQNLSRSLD